MTNFPNKQTMWASHIYSFKDENHSSKKDELISHVYDLKNQGKLSGVSDIAKTNVFESKFDFFTSELKSVQELKVFCENSLMHAVGEVNQYDVDYMSRLTPNLRESWAHVTNDNGYHDAHVHLNTSWGGIYYVNANECGQILDTDGNSRVNGVNRFYSPINYFTLDPSMDYLRHNVADIWPEDGVLVIFPAYLLHSATSYIGEKDRVVISFNAIVNQKEKI